MRLSEVSRMFVERNKKIAKHKMETSACLVVSVPSRLFQPIAMIAVTSRKVFNAPSDKMYTPSSP